MMKCAIRRQPTINAAATLKANILSHDTDSASIDVVYFCFIEGAILFISLSRNNYVASPIT